MLDGGKPFDKEEHIVKKTTELAAGAEAQVNTKLGFFAAIASKIGIEGSADIVREGSKIITKAVENTILTDYLKCAEGEGKDYVRIFSHCKPYPYPESFAYYKMITPYLIMTEGRVPVAEGLNINLAMMDQALDSGRGYYELITQTDADYTNRCGNCHTRLSEEDKYCPVCGTKRGMGKFEPFYNPTLFAYGPFIKSLYHCRRCGHTWYSDILGEEELRYCPECGKETAVFDTWKEFSFEEYFGLEVDDSVEAEDYYDDDAIYVGDGDDPQER